MSEGSALFMDRDGTLIEDLGYIADPADVRLIPGATDALRALQARGVRLIVVSNQSGIGRGMITNAQASAVHQRFVEELAREGVVLDDTRYCPHAPDDGCDCRKPQPGMLLDAARDLALDAYACYMIGDSEGDMGAGRAAGFTTIAFTLAGRPMEADFVAASWDDVRKIVLEGCRT